MAGKSVAYLCNTIILKQQVKVISNAGGTIVHGYNQCFYFWFYLCGIIKMMSIYAHLIVYTHQLQTQQLLMCLRFETTYLYAHTKARVTWEYDRIYSVREFRLNMDFWYADGSIISLRTLLHRKGDNVCTHAYMQFYLIYVHFPHMMDFTSIFSNIKIILHT